ncbi:hypothetical protein [Acetomicrobium sp.]|uniref:hypothetical protein n=1 Tax=Acetomicrobium sp. TaxID=1872099 RepID=UPI002FCBDB54
MQEIGSLKYQNSRLKNAIQFEPGYTYIDEIKKFDQKGDPNISRTAAYESVGFLGDLAMVGKMDEKKNYLLPS